MKRFILIALLLSLTSFLVWMSFFRTQKTTGAPPYVIEDLEPPDDDPYAWLKNWKRPDGPPRVGLQVGHWKNDQLPDELSRLKGNTGASGGGKTEAEVNLAIAQETAKLLEARGIQVDILPSTVPSKYWADVFIAIHADGSESSQTRGFKIAAPRRDYSGKAGTLVTMLEASYQEATNFVKDPNISRNMTGYYAFAWWRYDHAVHPKTASVIVETGFLTSPADRKTIVDKPHVSAQGIANGVIKFLESENLL